MATKILPLELGRDCLGLLLQLQIARLELGAVLLEAGDVLLGGAQSLLLRQQEITRIAVLDVDDVAHLAKPADALE